MNRGNFTVIKRNNRIERLDVSKIQKYTKASVEGLENVSQSELEVDSKIRFYDKMKTEDIQKTLIQTAVEKISLEAPNWTFVASRLFLYDLYHKVSGYTGYLSLEEYFKKGEEEGRILVGFKDKYDLKELDAYIKPKRDLFFNYLAIKTLYDRYLLKDKNQNPIELPQHMFMAISMFLAQNELDSMSWAKRFYDVLSRLEVMVATPTLSNARTPRHQLSSCYVGSVPDNIEGIFDSYKEMALLSKYGGGIGWDWSSIRGLGSTIDAHKNTGGGIIPFLKIVNDIAVAVDQLGTRRGAIAVYIETWHIDIHDFLDLKKNSGEERRRGHDLFPALWINNIFMDRVKNDEMWTLFDPYDTKDLCSFYGEEFNKRYQDYENDKSIPNKKIKAKELWKKILLSCFESGGPFLTFKDTANVANPNSHKGIIRSSNLCTEIFQNTQPDSYQVKIFLEDNTSIFMDEQDSIIVNGEYHKMASKVTIFDKIDGKQVVSTEKISILGDTAVCNLGSINLSKVRTKEEIERVVPIAIRMLDNVIDLNFYPTQKSKNSNLKTRAIGLGIMGEAELLAKKGIHWGSNEHLDLCDEIMECISFNAINASCNLSIEKGSYELFRGSKWSRGIFPIDLANDEAKKLVDRGGLFGYTYDWAKLKEKVIKRALRNGYIMSLAPTSSISILAGTTQTIEPIYKKMWFEENLSGLIPNVVPNLTADTWQYYTSSYDIDQSCIIKAAAIRQKWIDQGQSINIFVTLDKASGKYLNDIYMLAWRLGLKSTYYLRSQSPNSSNNIHDRGIECDGCQ